MSAMDNSTPPQIPIQYRREARRRSLQGPLTTAPSSRVRVQPASPEVISSLITSLSTISSPVNALFENIGDIGESRSTPVSPAATQTTFNNLNANLQNGVNSGGSFGIDYGAYDQPSLRDLPEGEPLDELAASPPVIRTAKPPSGFSPLTAPKSPREPNNLKSFLRSSSRPSSNGSTEVKDLDDASSFGNVSIEPGVPPVQELRRKSSSDSWGKKQARNHRGLMYMSSKEQLREKEQEKKRSFVSDRLSRSQFDNESFLAGTSIGEEPENGTAKRLSRTQSQGASPSRNGPTNGGLGAMFIPARDSSLRRSQTSMTKKRASKRSSRHSSTQRGEDENETQESEDTKQKLEQLPRVDVDETVSKMAEPLEEMPDPSKATTLASRQVAESVGVDEFLVVAEKDEDGAPSPAVSQRKARTDGSASYQKKRSSKGVPENLDWNTPQPKRTGSRLKRLSAPLSPKNSEKESKRSSTPLSRVTSPEPLRSPLIHVDERPSSADSIDDAVEAYLCSPRLSQKIRHPQTGRTISFSEVGDSEGSAVFCCVGMGLTRYITAFYDELALTLKLRLITPDRPGVGDSEPYADGTGTPLNWPDDVYAICQALKITKFSILAHSAGAIYALATALRMPQHIRGRIHLLAPWIPPSQMNSIGGQTASPPSNTLPTSQRILRALPTPILKAANSSFMSATSSSITSSLPKSKSNRNRRKSTTTGRDTPAVGGRSTVTPGVDKENNGRNAMVYPDPSSKDAVEAEKEDPNSEAAILAAAANTLAERERQTTYDERLTHAIWDLATSGANPAVDLLVCLERRHTIGFRYVDITRAVVIHHGSKDSRVPVENVRWLGKMMRRCEVRVLEGEGHGLMASAAVMGGILMEIAREWEDWMKITSNAAKSDGVRKTLRERASVGAFR